MNGKQFISNQTFKITGNDIHTIEGTIHTIFVDEYTNRDNKTVTQYKLVLDIFNPFGAPPRVCFTLPTSIAAHYHLDAMCGRTIGLWFKFRSIPYQKDGQERYVLNPIITAFEDTHGELEELLLVNNYKNQIPGTIDPNIFDNHTHNTSNIPNTITAQDIIVAADKLHSMLVGYEHFVSTNLNHSLDMVSAAITDIKNKQAKTLGLLDDDTPDWPF